MRKYIKESLKYLLRTRLFIHKYMDEIDAMYDMTPEELRRRNERRFLEIFRKVYFRSEYYRRLCLAKGVKSADEIQHLEDIIKLPILTKDMLKAHGKELLTRSKRGLMKNIQAEQREPRSPCFKIGHRYGENRLILFVIGNVVGITMVNQWFLCVGTWGEVIYRLKYM